MVTELPPTLFVSLDRLCSGLLRCVHGVFDLGCILVNYRLYTRLEASARTLCSPSSSPHLHSTSPSIALPLTFYLGLCYLVFILAVLIRSSFAMLFARPPYRAQQQLFPQIQFRSLFIVHPSCLFCVSPLSCPCLFLQKILPLGGFHFSIFQTHLILDTSPQVVSKNAQLKSANTWSSLKGNTAGDTAPGFFRRFIGRCLHRLLASGKCVKR